MKAVKVALIIVLCGVALNAHAEWGRTANDYIRLPFWGDSRICSDGNGGCWATGRYGEGNGVVHFGRDGDTTWGREVIQVLPNLGGYSPRPVNAGNGDLILGMNVILDSDPEPPYDSIVVYIQRINLDRELVWSENGIALDTSSRLQGILNVYKGPIEDTYLVHWSRSNDNFQNNDPRLQLINGDGELLWGIGGIGMSWQNTNSSIIITSDRCIIMSQVVDPDQPVEIVKINSDGERIWNSRLLTLWENVTQRAISDTESDREGGLILVYSYQREVTIDDSLRRYIGINALRMSSNGDSLWTRHLYEREKVGFEDFNGTKPIINYAGAGRFLIAWADWSHDFKVTAFDVEGELLWEHSVDIIIEPIGSSLVAVDSDHGVCYAWREGDDREDGSPRIQQWGQMISMNGERLWGDRGRAIQERNSTRNSIITDGSGGAISLIDFGNSGTVQMVNRNGEIGEVLPVGVDDDFNNNPALPGAFSIQLYPNPVNSHLRIVFDAAVPAYPIRYSLFNAVGRSVVAGEIQHAGSFEGDLSRLASGQYFLRLQSTNVSVTKAFRLVR